MVALCIFSVGGGFSVHEGVEKILASQRSVAGAARSALGVYRARRVDPARELLVLGGDARVPPHLAPGAACAARLKETRDPTVLTVLFEDLAALFGLVVAFGGIVLARVTGNVAWDGAASIVVGLALGAVAFVLARDTKSLLIGQSANEADERQIRAIVSATPRRRRARPPAHHAHGARGGHRRHQGALPRQPRHAHARAAHQRDRGRRCAPSCRGCAASTSSPASTRSRCASRQPVAVAEGRLAADGDARATAAFEIVPMKAADLDDIMDIERVVVSRALVAAGVRRGARPRLGARRRAQGAAHRRRRAGVRQLLAGARRGARAQRRHASGGAAAGPRRRACSSTSSRSPTATSAAT